MAKSLASLRRVKADTPPLMVAYGIDGIGKTTFASEWPDPVFIQIEKGTPGGSDLVSFGEINSFSEVIESMNSLLTEPNDFKTLVVDSLDHMEPLVWEEVCPSDKGGIEAPGFGKGYVLADDPWRYFLKMCKALNEAGIAVVLIAHSDTVLFESPTTDAFKRYVIKLHKRAAALVRETADIVGFFHSRISIKKEDNGFKKTTRGVGGGERIISLEERPSFLAKNRYQMPESVEYRPGAGYSAISKYFPQPTGRPPIRQAAE